MKYSDMEVSIFGEASIKNNTVVVDYTELKNLAASHEMLLDALKCVCGLFPDDLSDDNSGRMGFNRKSQITINEAREAIKAVEE